MLFGGVFGRVEYLRPTSVDKRQLRELEHLHAFNRSRFYSRAGKER